MTIQSDHPLKIQPFQKVLKQMKREATAEFQMIRAAATNAPFGLGGLGYAYGISDRATEARSVLEELTRFLEKGYEVQSDIALVEYGLGNRERALDWLEKALEAQTRWMPDLKYDTLWQNLHAEPRFVALLKKMALDLEFSGKVGARKPFE